MTLLANNMKGTFTAFILKSKERDWMTWKSLSGEFVLPAIIVLSSVSVVLHWATVCHAKHLFLNSINVYVIGKNVLRMINKLLPGKLEMY